WSETPRADGSAHPRSARFLPARSSGRHRPGTPGHAREARRPGARSRRRRSANGPSSRLRLQRRPPQSEFDGSRLKRDHQFLADAPQRPDIDMTEVAHSYDGLELLDPPAYACGKIGVGGMKRVRENRAVGEVDAGHVVAHVL